MSDSASSSLAFISSVSGCGRLKDVFMRLGGIWYVHPKVLEWLIGGLLSDIYLYLPALNSAQLEHGCLPSHLIFLRRQSSHARVILLRL